MRVVCLRYTGNETEAQDVFQDGFIKIFSNIKKFEYRGPGSIESWMRRIFINTALTLFSKKKKEQNNVDVEKLKSMESYDDENSTGYVHSVFSDDKDTLLESEYTFDELIAALNSIPELFRMVFNMFVLEDMRHGEIAEILNIDENTSRTRLLRARRLLQKELMKVKRNN